MMNSRIVVYGAGISGLVAAINLAREGFRVSVIEKQNRTGGSPLWHPSVHQQQFDVRKTSEYIGIDISPCFSPVKRHVFYFYGHVSAADMPEKSVVCEKGPRPSSIESFLYREAVKQGVEFVFGEALTSQDLRLRLRDGHKCIVATGLENGPHEVLGIRRKSIQGFRASQTTGSGGLAFSYFGAYTNHDFAYVASAGDLSFALLFARKGVNDRDLDAFKAHLFETEGLSFDDWHFSTGCVPAETMLIRDNVVLAGTVSGMIDPFFLNGISAALISGKVASLALLEPERAIREFNRFTWSFRLRRALKRVSEMTPAKRSSFPLFVMMAGHLRPVGVIKG